MPIDRPCLPRSRRSARRLIGALIGLGVALSAHLRAASRQEAPRLIADGQANAVLLARFAGTALAQHLGFCNASPVGPSLDEFSASRCLAAHHDATHRIAELNEGAAIRHPTGGYGEIRREGVASLAPAGFTREQVASYIAGMAVLALVIALWALVRLRLLHQRIARQAEELDVSHRILAEAQRLARLGHWQRSSNDHSETALWSDETYRVFDRDPQHGVPSLEDLIAYAIPADRKRWQAMIDCGRVQGKPYNGFVVIELAPGKRKTIHVHGRPWINASGRQAGTFGTVQDVTAARAAEEALRQSEQLLLALYDNLPQGLGVVERGPADWRLVSLNPAGLCHLGLAAKPKPGQALRDLGLPAEQHHGWSKLFASCVATTQPLKVEIVRHDPHRILAVTLVALNPVGDFARCCFLLEDVTDRKHRDAEIAQGRRLRAIGEMVGGIAHEFNNLLTPILLNADLLQHEWAHLPALRDDLKTIADAARRSADLTRRLLAFGRKSEDLAETIDLAQLVHANLELVRHTFDRRIRLESQAPAGLPHLYLNSGDVHQILLNLLVNARDTLTDKLDASPGPGWIARIEVVAEALPASASTPIDPVRNPQPARWVRLTVRDNGRGISTPVLERVFEPFYTTKPAGAGTGLGLATVWHLAAEFGGRVAVESKEGEGSAFHVFLPVRPPPVAAPAPPSPPLPASPAPSRRRLLVVEDDEIVSRTVTALLRREGHQVVLASDGQSAWARLSGAPADFDAVLMDLNMPGLSGLELARLARAFPYHRPLIVMTGRITDEERAELAQLQIGTIVDKPFTLETLQAALAKALPLETR